ncbi:flavoprotein [Longirhabdus pacifica]|uniref:flavoprotein n=1 Tax=Longirhabdus pacifica TaxID=2305227 RepID=UPI0013E8CB08|nr:flavoprotein [Longirhabdus pacifica]
MSTLRILIGCTGSIGAINLPQYVMELKKIECEIKLILTEESSRFVQPLVMECLVDDVYTDELQANKSAPFHIELASWCDVMLILPITANSMGKAAAGIADNVLLSTLIACDKPVIMVPNMNEKMWHSRIVQRNVETLKSLDMIVIPPTIQETYIASEKAYKTTLGMLQPKQLLHMLENSVHLEKEIIN